MNLKPTAAFVFASWVALLAGIITYLVGLWNADMILSEKGYYFTVLMFGLFGAVSVQKSVRDNLERIPVTGIYSGISWFATLLSIVLLITGLWNAGMSASDKGFYGMAFTLAMFAATFLPETSSTLPVTQVITEGLDFDLPQRPAVMCHSVAVLTLQPDFDSPMDLIAVCQRCRSADR